MLKQTITFCRYKEFTELFITILFKITIYNTVIQILTSFQNNSVIGKIMKRLCTCLISMAVFRSTQRFQALKQRRSQNIKLISILFSFKLKRTFWKYPKFF